MLPLLASKWVIFAVIRHDDTLTLLRREIGYLPFYCYHSF
ncbi:hypothetical protein ENHAE0001_1864 [Enhydrobacter aerosaccus SK60]|nr:hypothetical protein ENHAE0001_1864 [Enhydrobacter aerosaccus SK60]